ncbi:MAG: molybdenum cofactor guanylyltransferase [Cyanobacteria bacterium]|nr:molybdenum cofactor guanylyltransferase [Cyanobacteriota bacterium]
MKLAAVVLAGGHSRRMGQDKALLRRGDRPLIHHITQAALACTPAVWVMTPWPQRYRSLLPAPVQLLVETPAPIAPGPLVAFAQALTAIPAEWVLLLACDLPGVEGDTLCHWRDHLAALPSTAIAYLPRSPQGWEPLCGFYRATCRPSLETAIAQGMRGFQPWLVTQTVAAIPQVPAMALINCNTPADWQAYQSR